MTLPYDIAFGLGLAVAQAGVLLLAGRPGVTSSRRFLATTLALLVPVLGFALALLVRTTRGGGPIHSKHDSQAEPHRLCAADVRRLGHQPSILERLLSLDASERLGALVALSSRADAAAVALLRWSVEHGSSDVVLDAALTLEEIDLKREARLEQATAALQIEATFETALALADAAASGLFNGIADAPSIPMLAAQARSCYELARSLDATRSREIECRLARLEVAAAQPGAALALLDRLAEQSGQDGSSHEDRTLAELRQMREHAAFAARRFAP